MSTSREEYMKRKAEMPTTEDFVAYTGQRYVLKRVGPSLSIDVAEMMAAAGELPDADSSVEEQKTFGLKTMKRREDLFPVVLPKYVIEPVIYADDDEDAPDDGIRVADLHEEDKLGILGRLMNMAQGGRGAQKGKTFPDDERGSGDSGDRPSDK